MNWIQENFQIVILVLLGLASAVKSMFDAIARRKAEQEPGDDSEPEVPLDEDKSYRKPAAPGMPPPRAIATPPALRPTGYDVDAAEEAAAALKHQQNLAARLRQIRETKATTTGGASATRTRLAAKKVPSPLVPVALNLRQRLRNPAEIRRAVVLREILDPPVGLR